MERIAWTPSRERHCAFLGCVCQGWVTRVPVALYLQRILKPIEWDYVHAQAEPTSAVTRLAVFDLDGTSIDGQSGSLLAIYLFRRGMLGLPKAVRLAWWGVRYKLHMHHSQEEPRHVIFSRLGPMGREQADKIMDEFSRDEILPRLRKDAVAEVARRREEGCTTLLVSATFERVAMHAAEALGVDAYIATKMRTDEDGNYLSEVDGLTIEGSEKVQAVEQWADEHLGKGAWRLAYAYADHHSDEELLGHAEQAFAVCPGKTLRPGARRNDWPQLNWS